MRKLAIVLVLFSLLAVSCTTGISQEEYDELSSDLLQAQQEVETTQLALTNTLAELRAAEEELRAAEEELRAVRQELDTIQGQLEEAVSEVARLLEELDLYRETEIIVKSGVQPDYSKDPGVPVHLSNNPTATNPTWVQLKAFLLRDTTDERMYIDGLYTCGNFAEDVHDNAESSRIRSAFVVVHFEGDRDPHALNAFKTVDKGLLFIDCTGSSSIPLPPLCVVNALTGQKSCPEPPDPSHDGVAYVQTGSEYGRISLGGSTPFDYAGYENMALAWDSYAQRMEAYNREVEQYNRYIEGKVFYIGTPEWRRVTDWSDRLERESEALDREREQLETMWEPMGIISSIEIYW